MPDNVSELIAKLESMPSTVLFKYIIDICNALHAANVALAARVQALERPVEADNGLPPSHLDEEVYTTIKEAVTPTESLYWLRELNSMRKLLDKSYSENLKLTEALTKLRNEARALYMQMEQIALAEDNYYSTLMRKTIAGFATELLKALEDSK